MYYSEDYVDLIKETELLVKQVREFETDNEELRRIMALVSKLAQNNVALANAVALCRGVDPTDY